MGRRGCYLCPMRHPSARFSRAATPTVTMPCQSESHYVWQQGDRGPHASARPSCAAAISAMAFHWLCRGSRVRRGLRASVQASARLRMCFIKACAPMALLHPWRQSVRVMCPNAHGTGGRGRVTKQHAPRGAPSWRAPSPPSAALPSILCERTDERKCEHCVLQRHAVRALPTSPVVACVQSKTARVPLFSANARMC